MPKFIREREQVEETRYVLFFRTDSAGGYSYECDAEGNITETLSLAAESNLAMLRKVATGVVEERRSAYWQTAIIQCNRCNAQVELSNSWANSCESCGTEYNGSGQELAPRDQWGWETGESF